MGNFKFTWYYDYCDYCRKRVATKKVCMYILKDEKKILIKTNFPQPFKSKHPHPFLIKKKPNDHGGSTFTVKTCKYCIKKIPELEEPWTVKITDHSSDLAKCKLCDKDRVAIINYKIKGEKALVYGKIKRLKGFNDDYYINSCSYNTSCCRKCYITKIPSIKYEFTYDHDRLSQICKLLNKIMYKFPEELVTKVFDYVKPDYIYKKDHWKFSTKTLKTK